MEEVSEGTVGSLDGAAVAGVARALEVEAKPCHERGEFGSVLVSDTTALVSVKPKNAAGKDRGLREKR